jgi:dsDNA-specific endonuclease/ATPase MutS2
MLFLPDRFCKQLSACMTQVESEQMLQETEEARTAKLDFSGVYDVGLMLEAALQRRSLHPLHLSAVASTLDAAARLEEAIQRPGR